MRPHSEEQNQHQSTRTPSDVPRRNSTELPELTSMDKAVGLALASAVLLLINLVFREQVPEFFLYITVPLCLVTLIRPFIMSFIEAKEYRKAQDWEDEQELQKEIEKLDREYARLIDIEGAEETWTCDKILIRLRELKRYQERRFPFHKQAHNPENENAPAIKLVLDFFPDVPEADKISDTIYVLERTATRRDCHNNKPDSTPPETIIGYERE